jgi:hypothetical protein
MQRSHPLCLLADVTRISFSQIAWAGLIEFERGVSTPLHLTTVTQRYEVEAYWRRDEELAKQLIASADTPMSE